jgi:hypothetical protein
LKLLFKNYLLKNVTFFSLNKKLKINDAQYEPVLGNYGVHIIAQGHQGSNQGCQGGHEEELEPNGGLQGHPMVPRERACQRGFLKVILGCTDRRWSSHRDI